MRPASLKSLGGPNLNWHALQSAEVRVVIVRPSEQTLSAHIHSAQPTHERRRRRVFRQPPALRRLNADRVVLDAWAEDRKPGAALGGLGVQINVNQIQLVDFLVIALEGVRGEIGSRAYGQHDQRESDPRQFEPLDDFFEEEIVEWADDNDVQQD